MSTCPGCKTENPPGSKFCAGCGSALPREPVDVRCASCGAESPEGSRFCKECGKPITAPSAGPAGPGPSRPVAGASPPPPPPQSPLQSLWSRATGGAAAAGAPRKPLSPGARRIKTLLGAGAGLYAVSVISMFIQISNIQSTLGPYARFYASTDMAWFMIVVNAILGGLLLYAMTQIDKGAFKLAKGLFIAMACLGVLALLGSLRGPALSLLLNAVFTGGGIYGWNLVSREEKGL